jgi:hypothetical protein
MNSKILFVAIAIVTAFGIAAVVGLATVTPVLAQELPPLGDNITGDNMTMGDNMTAGTPTG